LFVTPDFKHLINVLTEFSETMAYKVGGMSGVSKAIECENPSTCVFSSGLQVSGVFSDVLTDDTNCPVYIKTTGPTQLAWRGGELPGHGKDYHSDGFGSPVGKLKGTDKPLEEMSESELADIGIEPTQEARLEFASGVVVEGRLGRFDRKDGKIILMTFLDCTVTYRGETLFQPAWGAYDMAVGENISSVFAGAADKDAYEEPSMVSKTRTVKIDYTPKQRELHKLYQTIRDYREGRISNGVLPGVWDELKANHPRDWLLPLEIVELLTKSGKHPEIEAEIKNYLNSRAEKDPELTKVIRDGLELAPKEIKPYRID
jgi:phenylalanine-4-hydroxylase